MAIHPPDTSIESQVYIDGGEAELQDYRASVYRASFYGQQSAKRIGWIVEADYSNALNRELFPYWQIVAVRCAIEAARHARKAGA